MILALASHPIIDLKELAKTIALRFGSKYIELDESNLHKNTGMLYNNKEKNCVYDSIIVANKIEENAVRVFIKYSREKLLQKLMKDRNVSFEDAIDLLEEEEKNRQEYLQKFFGINLKDLSAYDLVLNADNLDNEGIISVVERYVNKIKK